MSNESLPRFASNRPDRGSTVADEIRQLFAFYREGFATAPSLAIATAYMNPGGFALLSDELQKAPSVRLLLGAEPEQGVARAMSSKAPDTAVRLQKALHHHEEWLLAERDATGFQRGSVAEARQLVAWLDSLDEAGKRRVQVKRYAKGFLHGKAFVATHPVIPAMLAGSSNMTYAGLALNAELNLGGDPHQVADVVDWFEHYWGESEDYDLAALYRAQWQPHTPWVVFMRMLDELYGNTVEEERPKTSFHLAGFQADGVRRMERLLEELGGVLVADEVGLGKSFLAGEVIKRATEELRQRVLIICPAAIKASMWEPFLKRFEFSRRVEVLSFDEVRIKMDPDKGQEHLDFLNEVSGFAMVVVDEAHNLRNPAAARSGAVDRVILSGKHPKKVVLLTATPVNNSLMDLETLIRYFVRDDARFAHLNIPSIREYIKTAQSMDPSSLTPEHLFDLMDQVAVKRTRKFVKENYEHDTISGPDGIPVRIEFPKPVARRIDYPLDEPGLALVDAMIAALEVNDDKDSTNQSYGERKGDPDRLMLARYTPSAYSLDKKLEAYQVSNAGLLRSALLKRLESSPKALANTLRVLLNSHAIFLDALKRGYVLRGEALSDWSSSDDPDLESFIEELDEDTKLQVDRVELFHGADLIEDVESDIQLLQQLKVLAELAGHDGDPKFAQLLEELTRIAEESRRVDPTQKGLSASDRRKVIIFSSYSDTVQDIHDRLSAVLDASPSSALADYVGRLPEPVMGAYGPTQRRGAKGGVDQSGRATTLSHFAPRTAGKINDDGTFAEDKFDILVTTDVLAEGVNLQQAGQIINYDLPWNPMKIVQRHGRIDRIGSQHSTVGMGLFFPAERLNEMLHLEETLERKLAQAEAAVGTTISLFSKNGGAEVILSDPDRALEQLQDLLETRGSNVALSGEEYRRRLFNFYRESPGNKALIQSLPLGIGSGFENPRISRNGYVFCIRIAGGVQPWFRFVETNESWEPILRSDGSVSISGEALTNLVAADPVRSSTARALDDLAYDKAFDAWTIARDDAFQAWTGLTDPSNLAPRVPAAFRDGYQFVRKHGEQLGDQLLKETLRRLDTVPSKKAERAIRAVLNGDEQDALRVSRIIQTLDDFGIIATDKPKPLPPISKDQAELVAWMAVKGTKLATV